MGLMNKVILIILAAALSSCQSTRTETFQGEPIELEQGQELVKNRHQHNFKLWQRNEQQRIGGGDKGKIAEICPTDHGHGPMVVADPAKEMAAMLFVVLF